MNIKRMNGVDARHIIVYGEGREFTMFTLEEKPYTIYHRDYEGKHYDIVECDVDEESVYWEFTDSNEVQELLNNLKS